MHKVTGDEPTRESIRPKHLGWGAEYVDRPYCSRSKYASDRGARKRAARKRSIERRK